MFTTLEVVLGDKAKGDAFHADGWDQTSVNVARNSDRNGDTLVLDSPQCDPVGPWDK